MKTKNFDECNTTYAKNQKPYLPLRCFKDNGVHGLVVSCWHMNWRERIKTLFTGNIWLSILTLGNPLQPIKIEIKKPEMK